MLKYAIKTTMFLVINPLMLKDVIKIAMTLNCSSKPTTGEHKKLPTLFFNPFTLGIT